MKASHILIDAQKASNISNKEICKAIGILPNSYSVKLTKNNFKAQEMVDILDAMGFEIRVVTKDTCLEVPMYVRGTGPRVVCVIDGVKFDTYKASSVCCSDMESGRYRELYRVANDSFYIVCYSVWTNEEPTVFNCPVDVAADFYNKCHQRNDLLFEKSYEFENSEDSAEKETVS